MPQGANELFLLPWSSVFVTDWCHLALTHKSEIGEIKRADLILHKHSSCSIGEYNYIVCLVKQDHCFSRIPGQWKVCLNCFINWSAVSEASWTVILPRPALSLLATKAKCHEVCIVPFVKSICCHVSEYYGVGTSFPDVSRSHTTLRWLII